ncbi:related to Probable dipeptidyl-aminopeptidase B [Cephalotrichum gorgonifer]|uniref:Probable dipeptidyl-aminopeptidase B n=1 Tax=Cephalotrichum gorgonifer TaxID=2041049 RepID=A0AAE8SQW2_9PEZI|nr:related to Probable dipeptidyl-aminopeptidase B [Cephalotrichum gorgonifer]
MDPSSDFGSASSGPNSKPEHRISHDSLSSISTTSIIFERIEERVAEKQALKDRDNENPLQDDPDDSPDLENAALLAPGAGLQRRPMDKRWCRILCATTAALVLLWLGVLGAYMSRAKDTSATRHDAVVPGVSLTGNPVTLDQVLGYQFSAASHSISWIPGPDGEDGLLLQQGAADKDYLIVEDVRASGDDDEEGLGFESESAESSRTLIRSSNLSYSGQQVPISRVFPSRDLKKVLIASGLTKVWRHSFTATYWILDVETQEIEPLDPLNPDAVVHLATWSPKSDAVAFTKDNNLYLRTLNGRRDKQVRQVTRDGGPDIFYGIPDWVFEEEVFGNNQGTWWSEDGKFVAFFRADEKEVPVYPVQFFIQPPDGSPSSDDMLYPVTEELKYPKAGATNPVVNVRFYDVVADEVFTVDVPGGFEDDDRLITDVLWVGDKVLVKESNRVSDVLRVVLIDPVARTGKSVRTVDTGKLDGGWFEKSDPVYIPADPKNGRPHDGYVDTVVHGFGDHLAYFTPLDNPEPLMLTSGDWEVVGAPSAVDLANNLVYFVSTQKSSIERHIYSVGLLDGAGLKPVTNTSETAYYEASFSSGAGYALLNYQGPDIPWHKVVSTPSNPKPYEHVVEKNERLRGLVRQYDLPTLHYGTLEVEGVQLNYVERRPAGFNPAKKYPVLFQQYSGPGSQQVNRKFAVTYQSFVASSLGYVVVTLDGRGTGFIGRANRVLIRDHLGRYEAADQVAAGKHWASLPYVDASRLAIWGWSFGGFNALKTLEVDAGETFSYGIAVAPVTDWRFYDSIYTERYMRTPQENADGYAETAVRNASALGANVRFLVMHGVGDDNVHYQNTLQLLDDLDIAGVGNYDVHFFPDSNHGIYFHGATRALYNRMTDWLVNAFNGEWVRLSHPKPKPNRKF